LDERESLLRRFVTVKYCLLVSSAQLAAAAPSSSSSNIIKDDEKSRRIFKTGCCFTPTVDALQLAFYLLVYSFSLVQDLRTSSGQYGEGSNVPVQSLALPSSSSLAISLLSISFALSLLCLLRDVIGSVFVFFFAWHLSDVLLPKQSGTIISGDKSAIVS